MNSSCWPISMFWGSHFAICSKMPCAMAQRKSPIDVVIDHDHCVRVLSGGSIIQAEILAQLRMPFQRGTSVGPGGGLGLAIVDNIMGQLGGSLHLLSPATGRADGFEAILVFPAADKALEARERPAAHILGAPIDDAA